MARTRTTATTALPPGFGALSRVEQGLWVLRNAGENPGTPHVVIRIMLILLRERRGRGGS